MEAKVRQCPIGLESRRGAEGRGSKQPLSLFLWHIPPGDERVPVSKVKRNEVGLPRRHGWFSVSKIKEIIYME